MYDIHINYHEEHSHYVERTCANNQKRILKRNSLPCFKDVPSKCQVFLCVLTNRQHLQDAGREEAPCSPGLRSSEWFHMAFIQVYLPPFTRSGTAPLPSMGCMNRAPSWMWTAAYSIQPNLMPPEPGSFQPPELEENKFWFFIENPVSGILLTTQITVKHINRNLRNKSILYFLRRLVS